MITFKSKFAILAIILLVYLVIEVRSSKSHFLKTTPYAYPTEITGTTKLLHLNTYGFDEIMTYDFVTGFRYTKLTVSY